LAADPLLTHESLLRVPSAPAAGYRALSWTWGAIAKGVFLFALGMTQVWLYAWSKTEQERLDKLNTNVQRVRAQAHSKAYRYARLVDRFQVQPAEAETFQRLTPELVDRVHLPASTATVAASCPVGAKNAGNARGDSPGGANVWRSVEYVLRGHTAAAEQRSPVRATSARAAVPAFGDRCLREWRAAGKICPRGRPDPWAINR